MMDEEFREWTTSKGWGGRGVKQREEERDGRSGVAEALAVAGAKAECFNDFCGQLIVRGW